MATLPATSVIAMYFISSLLGSLASKYQFMTYSNGQPDKDGHTLRKFSHPWFQEILMFVGEFACLFVYMLFYRKRSDQLIQSETAEESGSIEDVPNDGGSRLIHWILFFPTLCDLTGSCLSGFITMWIDLSVQIMLGGSTLVFTAILSRVFLKRHLSFNQISGIVICLVGFIAVSASELGSAMYFKPEATKTDDIPWNLKMLAIIFLIIANVLRSMQSIMEEKILKSRNIHPIHSVGVEGLFGTIMTAILLVVWYYVPGPVAPDGRMEDIKDAVIQFVNSPFIIVTSVVFILCIPVLNASSQSMTKSCSALEASLISNFRTLTTWSFQVMAYYTLNLKGYGESLDAFSLIRLDGFIIMIIGMLVYNVKEDVRFLFATIFPSWIPQIQNTDSQNEIDSLNT